MIIDFTSTSQNSVNEIEYYNVRGQVVKTYQLSQLEEWVIKNELHITQGYEAKGGTGMVSDPNTDFKLVNVENDITDVLDNGWMSLTAMFYNEMNQNDFQSNNKPHQTRKLA